MNIKLVDTIDASNPVAHDIALPLSFVRDPLDEAAQAIRCRLQFFKGEWFADTREGIPYFDEVLVKAPSIAAIRSLVRRALLSEPLVTAVNYLELVEDKATRRLTVKFGARVASGAVLSSDDYPPFVLGE